MDTIAIFSSKDDFSTHTVVDWIKIIDTKVEVFYFSKIIVNEENRFCLRVKDGEELIDFEINNSILRSAYFRKNFEILFHDPNTTKDRKIDFYLETELYHLKYSIYCFFNYSGIKVLGKNMLGFVDDNKITSLILANKIGFLTPDTIITNKRDDILLFKEKHKSIISKPILDGTFFEGGTHTYGIYTSMVTDDVLNKMGEYVFPSIIQKYIEKSIELRIFIIGDDIYTAAIFSQGNENTKIDYRRSNGKFPSRIVPFRLPSRIEDLVRSFMNKSTLNTGSIDLIVTPTNEYYFLEVNPVGQYGMMSQQCNFFLEKEVALFLL